MNSTISVSVIVPAYNAAATLTETLASLQSQTHPYWEAIIVDDGSSDETVRIAEVMAASDLRIRVIRQANQGVCVARNCGIELAQYEWLLFLDSDDWIVNDHLEKMTGVLAADATIDVVYCGWTYVSLSGEHFKTVLPRSSDNMFALLALHCPFSIHGCLNRKTIIAALGGFDTTMAACEDWDLWLRVARTGAKFSYIYESLALYRMRPGSLSRNVEKMITDGLRVMTVGRISDPRVPNPHADYAQGHKPSDVPFTSIYLVCWNAARLISEGQDARSLLSIAQDDLNPSCDYTGCAICFFESLPLSLGCTQENLVTERPKFVASLIAFLEEMERRSGASLFAKRALDALDKLMLEETDLTKPMTIGNLHGMRIDLAAPIENIVAPPGVEILVCHVLLDETELGVLELPLIDGQVSAYVLRDALTATYCWPVLGQYFEQTVFADNPNYDHDQDGWETFLQQVWNRPGLPTNWFYEENLIVENEPLAPARQVEGNCLVELAEDLPDLQVTGDKVEVVVTIAGCTLCSVTLPTIDGRVTAHRLLVAINLASGIELCRMVVREALLGQPFDDRLSLQDRLRLAKPRSQTEAPPLKNFSASLVMARRNGPLDSSIHRRYALPAETNDDIASMAKTCGEHFKHGDGEGGHSALIYYAPEWLVPREPDADSLHPTATLSSPIHAKADQPDGTCSSSIANVREKFESCFALANDPWKYTSEYEQKKYDQTMSLLQPEQSSHVLELACAEGHFTHQLAKRANKVTSVDISKLALQRAAERCHDCANVTFQQGDFFREPIEGTYDSIVCSEVLYYVGGKEELRSVAEKIVGALKPGGRLVTAHGFQTIDAPGEPGFDWGCSFGAKTISETFQSLPEMELEAEIRTPLYSVQAFRRRTRWRKLLRLHHVPRVEKFAEQPTPLPQHVADKARWHGETSAPIVESAMTNELPILMYHRVASTGSKQLSTHRVSPEQFEEQLEYLRGAGYYSIDWSIWCAARVFRKPLPGRAILLTFDDGYQDFYDTAWPLLKKYGFSATVFLVADYIGGANDWDRAYGERVELMDWPTIHELQAAGIQFGSHTATHQPLTGLSTADVVRQLARSRRLLQSELGTPVTTIAYPYGDCHASTHHLAGACGYQIGVTCVNGHAKMEQSLLALPRINIAGEDSLADFIRKLQPM